MPVTIASMFDDYGDDPSPICGHCGVSVLPAEVPGEQPACENADCAAVGQPIDA